MKLTQAFAIPCIVAGIIIVGYSVISAENRLKAEKLSQWKIENACTLVKPRDTSMTLREIGGGLISYPDNVEVYRCYLPEFRVEVRS